jgi:O-antigen/teichoic acid export membrane protein
VRVPTGILMYVGPLLVIPLSSDLTAVVAVLVAGRLIALLAHVWLCLRCVPSLRERIAPRRSTIKTLLRLGGWMSVSNVVGPIMVNLDRFLIGAFLSVVSVAYYATPYDMITRLSVVPAAMVSALFPPSPQPIGTIPGKSRPFSSQP